MPWFVNLVCAPAEPAVSAIAAPINAARQWSSLMVFPRVRRRRGAGGAGDIDSRAVVARLVGPILAQANGGGQRTEKGSTEACSPDGAKRNRWPKAKVPAKARTSINMLP